MSTGRTVTVLICSFSGRWRDESSEMMMLSPNFVYFAKRNDHQVGFNGNRRAL